MLAPSAISSPFAFFRRAAFWPRAWSCAVALLTVGTAFGHGALHERIAYFREQIAGNPSDASLYCRVAELHIEHGEVDEALAVLLRAETIRPGFAEIDLVRGEAHLQAGRPAEALTALDRCLAASPDLALAHLRRARAHTALDAPGKAFADYRAALDKASVPDPDTYRETADAYAKQGRVDEALQILDEGTRTLGTIPSLTLRSIEIESAAGRHDAALARITQLQKTAPRPEPWMVRRAELLAHAGRPAEARAVWQALLEHLAALPPRERGAHAMFRFAERARRELAASDPAKPTTLSQTLLPVVR